jgi:hypothetical protein
MMNMHPLAASMRAALTEKPVSKVAGKLVLDAVGDDAPSDAAGYAQTDVRLKSVAVVQQWAETSADDLGDGESMADRLLAMVVGAVDVDKDGELDEAEAAVCDMVLNSIYDYLADKGVSDEDCSALLNDWDVAAADRVVDLIVAALPDGDEAAAADMDSFVFDADSDGAVFDAVYKKKVVVRHGKKVRINKRVSGHVRLSAKQKISIRKMLRKSHSAGATMRRMKSVRIRKQAGL